MGYGVSFFFSSALFDLVCNNNITIVMTLDGRVRTAGSSLQITVYEVIPFRVVRYRHGMKHVQQRPKIVGEVGS